MAEIHVETKKHNTTPAWIWILIAVIVLAVVAYFLTRNKSTDQNNSANKNTTSYVPYHSAKAGNAIYIANA